MQRKHKQVWVERFGPVRPKETKLEAESRERDFSRQNKSGVKLYVSSHSKVRQTDDRRTQHRVIARPS